MSLQTEIHGFVCTGERVDHKDKNGNVTGCHYTGKIVNYSVTQEGLRFSDNVSPGEWARLVEKFDITTSL